MPKISWGILSCADIGLRAVVPALRKSTNGQIVAIASRNLARAQQAAAAHDIPRAYGNYDDLLNDSEVQAIYIPLPNSEHRAWTLRAIEHGKHVLIEKPLAMTPGEVDEIAQAAANKHVLAMEALMYRFHPQTERVLEIIRSGKLGAVQLVSAAFTYHVPNPDDIRLKRALGGGCLLDVGTYCVSVARMAMQGEPTEIVGRARIGPQSDVDEVFAGLLRFSGGRQATFGSTLHGPRDQWYKISGADATLTVTVPFAPGMDDRELMVRRGWQRGKEIEERIVVPGVDQYQLMVEHFSDCISSGRIPAISLSETRHNVDVVDRLMQDARSAHQTQ